MEHTDKGSLQLAMSQQMGAAAGILNGLALSVGIWCTFASVWLLVR